MAAEFTKSWKKCATCEYWGGPRQIDSFGHKVTVDSNNVKGKCLLQGGPWKGHDKKAIDTCNKWKLWSVMK